MREQPAELDTQPWYRQGWPWLLISLPASAVIGGIVTFVLAVQSPNALVVDDYYKQGLAINQQKQRLAAAETMGLEGLLRYDGKQVQLELLGTTLPEVEQLMLRVVHSTRAELDRSLTLQQGGCLYSAPLDGLAKGNWYLYLQPPDQSWEIRGRVVTDGPFQTLLTPQD